MLEVTAQPSEVRTPLLLLMAVRVNDPATGSGEVKATAMLHMPSAIISWVASTIFSLEKALPMEMISRIETSGIVMIDVPITEIMSPNA